jgi:hypothetical protein
VLDENKVWVGEFIQLAIQKMQNIANSHIHFEMVILWACLSKGETIDEKTGCSLDLDRRW